MKTLMAMADALGFHARPVKVDLNDLQKLKCPCILHWDMTHFVVLKRVGSSFVEVHDPAAGYRRLTVQDVSRHFTGVALELIPASKFEYKARAERLKLSDLWTRSFGLKGGIAQILLLSVLLQFFSLLSPLVSQIVVDDVLTKGDRDLLTVLMVGGVLLLIVQTATSAVRSLVTLHLTTTMTFFMRGNLLRHVLALPIAWFEKRRLGDILSRFSSLQPIQDLLAGGVISLVIDGGMAILTVAVMLAYSASLSAVVFVSLAAALAGRMISFPIMRRLNAESIQRQAKVDGIILETLRGARAFRLFGRERERHASWQNAYADSINNQARMQLLSLQGGAAAGLLSGAESLVVLYFGARAVMAGELTIGMLMAFQSYRSLFSASILSLISQFFKFRMLGLHLDRLSDVAHQEPEIDFEDHQQSIVDIDGSLELKNVSFRYADHEPWILRHINIAIKRGEFVALTGPSGGGKSTLLKIMMGLYEPTEGEVQSNGLPLKGARVRNFREHIGVVMQDDQLFAGTIADNISFFDTEVDSDRVELSAKSAFIHGDILRMPMGYLTLVGDLGSTLSGGQQQRILLARALYREPKIVFLDEGTANLDLLSERKVMQTFATLEVTRVVVAHRPTALEGADRLFAVEAGTALEVAKPAHVPSASVL